MSSNTENTEAKLAAYIDGQLDPAERAQIEQYLQANPEHRKLLADMIAQRDLLRSLPRDKAPADIYDAIQAQLERSVLLDDSAQSVAPVVRHSRRSQFFAIAAILLLAVGLCGVLYFALPSTRPTAIDVATVGRPDATNSASQPTTTLAYADEKTSDLTITLAKPRSKSAGPALAEGPADSFKRRSISNSNEPNPTYQALSGAAAEDARDIAKSLGRRPGRALQSPLGESGQLVLLVSTDNPSRVNQEVASYLESNNIHWETVEVPTEQVLYSRTAGRQELPQKLKAVAIASDKLGVAVPADRVEADDSSIKQKALPEESTEVVTSRREVGTLHDSEDAPATVPAIAGSQVAHLEQKEQLTPTAAGQVQPQSPQAAHQMAATQYFYEMAKNTSGQQYIVARGMTRQQAIALTDTLSTDGVARRARLIGQAPARVPAEKWFDDQNEPKLKLKLAPATVPAAESTPAAVEGVTSTATGAVPAAVAPEQEAALADAVAKKDEVVVGGVSVEARPSTVPVGEFVSSNYSHSVATTVPAATQPDQSDTHVDVVILVEDESVHVAPATAPTTVPATQASPE